MNAIPSADTYCFSTHNVLDLSVRSSVCPFVRSVVCYQLMNAIFWKRINRFQCKSSFRATACDDQSHTSGGQRSRSQVAEEVGFGGITLDPLSRVDRGIQWATEMLPLKRGRGVEYILTAPPRRRSTGVMPLVDAFVIILFYSYFTT